MSLRILNGLPHGPESGADGVSADAEPRFLIVVSERSKDSKTPNIVLGLERCVQQGTASIPEPCQPSPKLVYGHV